MSITFCLFYVGFQEGLIPCAPFSGRRICRYLHCAIFYPVGGLTGAGAKMHLDPLEEV